MNDIVEVYNPVRAIVGRNIEDATRTCVLNDCQNGAICTIATTTSNYPYTCSCNLGWEGRLCNSGKCFSLMSDEFTYFKAILSIFTSHLLIVTKFAPFLH